MRAILESTMFQRVPIQGEWGDPYNGAGWFRPIKGQSLFVIFSNGEGWEHVSVSRRDRTPTWEEMCLVKDFFFHKDEVVVQFHPAEKDYVNFHEHCLHLWRPIDGKLVTPPTWMIGPTKQEAA